MKKYVALFCILSTLAHAEEDTVFLPKDKPAPFEGYLLNPERAERVRLMKIDLTSCVKISDLKDKEQDIIELRLNNAIAETKNLSERLAQTREDGMLGKIGYFILGSVITTVLAYGVSKAVR